MATKTKEKPAKRPESASAPFARVVIGGQERALLFTMWSMDRLEEETGRPWWDVLAELKLGYQRASLRLLWACLQHEDEPPTIKQLGMMLPTDGSAQAIFAAADEVLTAALPQLTTEGKGGPLAGAPAA